ncbi:transposable element Tcb1 transposase [Trichonephila clavipes]|nr:transposable element Tcb1 transposase [Trichonephila clavipes]
MQRDNALRIAGRGRLTSFSVEFKTGAVETSGTERCHLHEDQAQDALNRPVVVTTAHRKECTRTSNSFIDHHPGTADQHDNRVRVWRPRGERLNPAFDLQRHTASTAGVMVWGDIAYNTRSHVVLIRGTMIAQR